MAHQRGGGADASVAGCDTRTRGLARDGYKTGTSSTLNNIVVHFGAMVVGVCCIAA